MWYFEVTGEEVHDVSFHFGEVVEVQAIALRPQKILIKIDHRFDLSIVAHDLPFDDQVKRVVDEGYGSWVIDAVPSESRKKMGEASLIILDGGRGTQSSWSTAKGN